MVCVGLAVTVVGSNAAPALLPAADEPPPAPFEDRVTIDPATQKAIDRALRFLARVQLPDGSWGNTAMTGFALLALMANGHLPNQGEHAKVVAAGVRHLITQTREDGYLINQRGGNMYCHGIAALALTQVVGMTGDPEVRKVTRKAIDLIIKTQNFEGGWRYDPSPTGADISVTIMQVMALRGAKDIGLHVPDRTMENSLRYISRCRDTRTGGYKYMPYSAGTGFARTAAGICVLQLCGKYEAEEIKQAVEYLQRVGDDRAHYWYGHYYAAHALHQVGGEVWERYYKRMRDILLSPGYQRPTGEWHDPRREPHYGPVYSTSIAVLILSIPAHYLPIYQK
jgi:hypothetical protein